MKFKTVFSRYEYKYLITPQQKETILSAMEPYMTGDQYGCSTIRNLYFDTDDYLLIRRSIEKPKYKEKLRVRSYTKASANSTVFVELKKKTMSVVFKRRLTMTEQDAMAWLGGDGASQPDCQIGREIQYALSLYKNLHPTVFLSYQREAYFAKDDPDFRITFDQNVLCRQDRLSLQEDIGGHPILPEGKIMMEIKCGGGMPLWITHLLAELKIYKTSFSKYGTAYKTLIFPKLQEELHHDNIGTTIQRIV